MLIAVVRANGVRSEATHAVKEQLYDCPGCHDPVTLKRGRIRRPYFAHRPGAMCSYDALETREHQQAKEDFAAAYRARGLSCDVEAEVLSTEGDRRADVLLHAPGNAYRVALEIQHSAVDYFTLERRTSAYFRAGVAVMWVPVLVRKRLPHVKQIVGTNIFYIDQYAATSWQLWVHDLQNGLWFYDPVTRGVWRGLLDACMRYQDTNSWFANGEVQSSGGGWRRSLRWSSLFLQGPFNLANLRVRRSCWGARQRQNYRLPGGIGANFMLAGEPHDYSMPVCIGRTKLDSKTDFWIYAPLYQPHDLWQVAPLEAVNLPETI